MSENKNRRRQETWKASDVLCPFYMQDNSDSLVCEGVMEGTTDVMRFRSAVNKNKHMGVYCAGRFQSCPKYKNVYDNKYAD